MKIAGFGALAFGLYTAIQRSAMPAVFYKEKLAKNYNARTIPPFGIFIKKSEKGNQELLNHELVHWRQFQDKGLIRYYLQYRQEFRDHGYDKMPMEYAARVNESEYCKENYTECVRNGKSNTVHNSSFRKASS